MIGYYVHHVGRGHLHRARAVIDQLGDEATVLSSLRRPPDWPGRWVTLRRDDEADVANVTADHLTAGGCLHWVPLRDEGLRVRSAQILQWIHHENPAAMVADVSTEVALLARLAGVPVVTVALPGSREDPAHQLAFGIAEAVIAPWPDLGPSMCTGLAAHAEKVTHVGGISRFDGRMVHRRTRSNGAAHVVALRGSGGGSGRLDPPPLSPSWIWTELGPSSWVEDPWPQLCGADVVVTHCGLGALSDVAAARRPAVLLPEPRPHGEQHRTAAALAERGVAIVIESTAPDWSVVFEAAQALDPDAWRVWSTGDGARRAAAIIDRVARS